MQQINRSRGGPDAVDLDRARAFIEAIEPRFTAAASVPEHPHQYVARSWLSDEQQAEFDWLTLLIGQHGYKGTFQGQTWTYVDLDGWAFWLSKSWHGIDQGVPNTMLNRRRLTDGQLRLDTEGQR